MQTLAWLILRVVLSSGDGRQDSFMLAWRGHHRLGLLCIMLGSIFSNGYTALRQTGGMVKIEIPTADLVDASGAIDPKKIRKPSIGRVLSKNRFARFFRMLPA